MKEKKIEYNEENLKKLRRKRKIYEILAAVQTLIFVLVILLLVIAAIQSQCRDTNSARGGLASQEIAMYNAEFESYLGDSRTRAQVKSLVRAVMSHNNVNDDNRLIIFLKYVDDITPTTIPNYASSLENADTTDLNWIKDIIELSNEGVRNVIKSGYTYNVTADTEKSGRIIRIEIKRIN